MSTTKPKYITERTGANGVAYQADFRKKGLARIRQTFSTLADAEKFIEQCESQLREEKARVFDPFASLPPSGNFKDELLQTTLALFSKSDSFLPRHAVILPTILKHVGTVTIGNLGANWIRSHMAKMLKTPVRRREKTYVASTIVGHLKLVKIAINWRAKQLGVPAPEFSLDSKVLPVGWDVERARRLEFGEEQALMNELRAYAKRGVEADRVRRYQVRLLVRLAIETGARLQELVKAEWKHFYRSEPQYRVYARHLDRWQIWALHTKVKKARKVPLSPAAILIVRVLKKIADPNNPRVFHRLGKPSSISATFHNIVARSEIDDFRFHDLRHEAISRMVLHPDCYSPTYLMDIVGHAESKTFRRYLTVRDSEMNGFMRRVRS